MASPTERSREKLVELFGEEAVAATERVEAVTDEEGAATARRDPAPVDSVGLWLEQAARDLERAAESLRRAIELRELDRLAQERPAEAGSE